MGLETATYISDLNSSNPTSSDPKSAGDNHLRLLKEVLLNSFPGITGSVSVTHTDLNTVTAKANKAGETYTGAHNFTGGTVTIAEPVASNAPVTKAYADTLTFNTMSLTPWVIKTTTYAAANADRIMADTSGGAWTLTLPASPVAHYNVEVADYAGTFGTNNLMIDGGAEKIMGLAQDLYLDINNSSVRLVYMDSTRGWVIV